MGGRTFDVLATRYPIEVLQSRLDEAADRHPESETLADFRVSESLMRLENEAFENALRVVTPHRDVGLSTGERYGVDLCGLDWVMPELGQGRPSLKDESGGSDRRKTIAFPASPLGKKGVYELRDALKDVDAEVLILGNADEGVSLPNSRRASLSELMRADVVVLPAYVEHSPRPLLRAMAMGIPVVASKACGLPEQEGLTLIDRPEDLRLEELL